MSQAIANPDDLKLQKFLVYSICLHAALTTLFFLGPYLQHRGNRWGSVGGGASGTKVSLVSSAAIPMPKAPNPTESKVVDPTKGLYKEEPPKPPEPKTNATKIPKFEKEKPLPPSRKSRVFEDKIPPPENAVPYGKGGNPNLPTGATNPQTPAAAAGGLTIPGDAGGDFASRYGWYVASVKRLISANWLQNTIDPAVRSARRAHTVVNFTINRDGSIKNIRIMQTSGNLSMDNSAQRALLSIEKFQPLPSDYNHSSIDVIFDFDLSMNP
jgi:TonB family protein